MKLKNFILRGKNGWCPGDTWAMGLISSIEEALSCKYPLICSKNDKKLISLFNNVKKNINKNIKK